LPSSGSEKGAIPQLFEESLPVLSIICQKAQSSQTGTVTAVTSMEFQTGNSVRQCCSSLARVDSGRESRCLSGYPGPAGSVWFLHQRTLICTYPMKRCCYGDSRGLMSNAAFKQLRVTTRLPCVSPPWSSGRAGAAGRGL
jgi:hypothetical protein